MLQSALADLLVVAHLGFIVFAAIGGLFALRHRWAPWIHLPAVAWAAVVAAMGWVCPLTPLENALRRGAGEQGYSGGFIEHYVVPVIYPAGLTRELQIGLGVGLLALNLAIYLLVWRRLRIMNRKPAQPEPADLE